MTTSNQGKPAPVTRLVRCPTCGKSTRYDPKNAHRPFCSPFCKDQDIINWAEQRYAIAGKPAHAGEEPGDNDPGDNDVESLQPRPGDTDHNDSDNHD